MNDEIAAAITDSLISPNEVDQNFEAANVVDGLFAIARALEVLAGAVENLPLAPTVETKEGR